MKRMISIMLVLAMVIGMLPMTAWAAEGEKAELQAVSAEVSCGENLTWTFEESTGTLTISGEGDMYDFSGEGREPDATTVDIPWEELQDQIIHVVLNEGVTSIGSCAFEECTNLTDISIPESLLRIGEVAFQWCSSLTEVKIPASTTNIGFGAFVSCYNLEGIWVSEDNTVYSSDDYGVLFDKNKTELIWGPDHLTGEYVVPDSVVKIHDYAFALCTGVTSIALPAGLSEIGERAFMVCYGLRKFTVPDSNEYYICDEFGVLYNKEKTALICVPSQLSIEDGGFIIPDTVSTIFDYACNFYQSQTISIPNGVAQIPDGAFFYSTLNSIAIPGSVKAIGDSAFQECTNLSDVYFGGTEEQWGKISVGSNNEYLINATIHFTEQEATPCQHNYVDGICTSCGEAEPDYTVPEDKIVAEGICGDNVTWKLDENGTLTISGEGAMTNYDIAEMPWRDLRETILSVVIQDGITTIGDCAFDTCENLSSVEIPDSVTAIGWLSFRQCDGLSSITIPDSISSIGKGAFQGCANLTSVIIPAGVTAIGLEAFGRCKKLTGIFVDEENPNYSSDTFGVLFNKNKTELIQAPGAIGPYTIPDSVTTIGEFAFYNCNNLNSITIPNSVTTISAYAFCNCSSLNDVLIPSSVTYIGEEAFASCDRLSSITIPAGVTFVGEIAFWSCDSLKGIWVDEENPNYSSDASGVLFNKDKTELIQAPGALDGSYTIPAGVTTISFGAFAYCHKLNSVTISDSVSTIAVEAFFDCEMLSSVTIPDSVTSIGKYAFNHCDSLTDVYYAGSEEEWAEITKNVDICLPTNVTIHFNSTGPDVGETGETSVRYFREWVPERQVVCWGKESDNVFYYESLVTEESDKSFLDHLDELVGNYVLVETKENDQGLVGVDVVLSIKPLDAVDIGVVTAISTTDRTITIEGTTYAYTCEFVEEVPKTGDYVRFCVYEGKIVSVVILESSSNESIRYFSNWDEPSQTATFGRDVQSMVKATDDTDKSFLNDLDNLLGKYVLVECITIDGVTELVSIKAVETKFGKVTAIDGASVTIDGTKYEDSGWSLLCGVSVDDRILCHFYEGTVIAVEILQIHTGKLMGWNKNTREVSIALDNEPDLGALGYSLSVLATNDSVELLNRLSSGSTTIVTEIWFVCDAQGFVYYISDSEPPEVDPGQQPDDIPEFDKPNYDNSESDIEVLKGYIFEYLEEFERYYNSPKKESDKTFAAAVENAILNDAEISAEKVKEEAIEKSAKKMKSDDDGNSDKLISGEDGSTGFRDIAYKALATHYYEVVSNKTPNISDIDISDYAGTTKLIREIISNLSSSSQYYKIDNELVFVSISDAFGAKMGQIQISGITFFVNSTRTMCEAAIKDYLIEMEELAKNEAWGIVNDLSSEILSKPLSTLTENTIKKYIKNFAKKFDMEIDEFLTKCGLADLPDILNNFCSFYDLAKKIEKAANSQDIVSAVNNIKNIDIKDIKFNDKVVDGCYKKLKGIINKIIDELENYQKEGTSEKKSVFNLNFNCPIEIAVYSADGSQQIGFVGEEEVWHNDSIAIQTHGKVKGIQVFSDEIPTFVITATDLGTMNCSVEERNDENEPIGRILFYDIPLTANETYELKLKKDLQSNRDSIAFETDNNTFYADQYIAGGDRRAVSISCNVESAEAGDIYGTGTYACGDVARLYARAKEGFVFVGWYDGEELVNDSLIYEFITKEDRSLTAKFAANNTVYINIINGEGGSSIGEGTVEKNQPVTVIAFARHGYAFEGWYLNEQLVSNEIEYNFIAVEDITLEVRFVNHTHDYSVPDFVWSEDFSCYSVISCLSCTYETHIECDISKETIPATETETGENIYTATVGFNGVSYTDTKTEIIPATGHTSHTAGNEWLSDKTNHWHVCTGCDEIMDLSAHSGGTATCAEAAVCTVCGTSYGKTNSDNHTGETEIRNAKDATAYEDGYTGDTYCLDCGGIIALGKKIPALTTVQRISGKDRVKTALSVARALKDTLGVDKFDAVIIATGVNEKFADALAGSYLANRKKAPILLYTNSGLSQLNVNFIRENLKANGTVYILGGDSAVPTTVEQTLAAYNVVRLSGKTRYETNLKILEEAGISGNEILVATGTNFADSLSASAVGLPLLLVNGKNTAPNAVQTEFLKSVAGKKITIIGGDGAVSEEMKAAIEKITGVTAERISGKTRHNTSVMIAQKYFPDADFALITYAKNFPDGLAGGPLAYAMGAPLLLTSAGQEGIAGEYITAGSIENGYVLGGDSAVSDETARKVFGLAADAAIEKAYYTE